MEVLSTEQTIDHLKWFQETLDNELSTYRYITNNLNGLIQPKNGDITAGLGFGMALTAFGGLDLLAYILFGGEFNVGENSSNFDKLLITEFFIDEFKEVDHKIFYKVLRNGMVHQLMPRGGVGLAARTDLNDLLIPVNPPGNFVLNTYYLLEKTVEGYEKFISKLEKLNREKDLIEDYNLKLSEIEAITKKQVKSESEIATINTRAQTAALQKVAEFAPLELGRYAFRLTALILNDKVTFLQAFEKKFYPDRK